LFPVKKNKERERKRERERAWLRAEGGKDK
jgi:hypothetical protein